MISDRLQAEMPSSSVVIDIDVELPVTQEESSSATKTSNELSMNAQTKTRTTTSNKSSSAEAKRTCSVFCFALVLAILYLAIPLALIKFICPSSFVLFVVILPIYQIGSVLLLVIPVMIMEYKSKHEIKRHNRRVQMEPLAPKVTLNPIVNSVIEGGVGQSTLHDEPNPASLYPKISSISESALPSQPNQVNLYPILSSTPDLVFTSTTFPISLTTQSDVEADNNAVVELR